jgi:hypothetical protein
MMSGHLCLAHVTNAVTVPHWVPGGLGANGVQRKPMVEGDKYN